jgi:hypothetical protein
MKSIRAIAIGILSGWLLACLAINALFLCNGDFDARNGFFLTLVIVPFWTSVAMFPGLLIIGILRYHFSPLSAFWDFRICSVVGFIVGTVILFAWWILLAGIRYAIPPFYEPRTWFYIFTAGLSAALSFSVTAVYLKKIQA